MADAMRLTTVDIEFDCIRGIPKLVTRRLFWGPGDGCGIKIGLMMMIRGGREPAHGHAIQQLAAQTSASQLWTSTDHDNHQPTYPRLPNHQAGFHSTRSLHVNSFKQAIHHPPSPEHVCQNVVF